MGRLLDQIIKENDIKNIPPEDYKELAFEIRKKLVQSVSKTGGHLASNLGTVELTMALHLFLDLPEDKLVWDVGHQAYVHKILTGRHDAMNTLRQMGGLSGFPKRDENVCDVFDTGHSSTSISVALGLAKARDIRGTDEKIFAVIGDGSLSGGMAFEALNNASTLKTNMVVVLNDNKMSIAKNVGAMSNYLGKIRANEKYRGLKDSIETTLERFPNLGTTITHKMKRAKDSVKHFFVPGMLFEDMGWIYFGPIDGHNINAMKQAFEAASKVKNQPAIVHVITKKGKGYKPAEQNPSDFHGVGSFDIGTGEIDEMEKASYTDVFGHWILEKGAEDESIVAISAAMPDGTGLNDFQNSFPDRFFDVGIAEEHAVTFAAGMSVGGLKPVVSLYSTFLQRAYDQIIHDVCIGNIPVVFAIDRSGVVGKDGQTHQGIFDISYLSTMPNMTILSPMDASELVDALDFAVDCVDGPVAVRYPRAAAYKSMLGRHSEFEYGKAEILKKGKDVVMLSVGNMVEKALLAAKLLEKKKIHATVVNMRFVKPFDEELVYNLCKKHKVVVTLEDNVYSGGFSQMIFSFLAKERIDRVSLVPICLPDVFVEHGQIDELHEKYQMDEYSVAKKVLEVIK